MGDRRGSYGSHGGQQRGAYGAGQGGAYGYGGGRGGGRGFDGKRKRDEPEDDGLTELCYGLFYLGDRKHGKQVDERPPELQVEQMAAGMRRLMHARPADVTRFLLDCCVELGYKVPTYAMLLGLLNADDSNFGAAFVRAAAEGFGAALAAADVSRARLLLRLQLALAVPGVLHPSAVLGQLEAVVKAALQIAEEGGAQDEGRAWQPYADALVGAALMALPWGGSQLLAGGGGADLNRLWASVEAYMAARPRATQPGLAPFFAANGPEDAAAQSDSGGASFLGQVWDAVRAWRELGDYQLEGIPRLKLQEYEAVLATGESAQLPPPDVPHQPVAIPAGASPAEAAAAVLGAFPPRGAIALLSADATGGGRPPLERLIAQDYIIDSMRYFDGDRVESAVRLASGLPLPYKHESLLAEALFAQMLRVPAPSHKPVAYGALMVDLCKLLPTFPRSMSACVRECFARLKNADPELRGRLAEWLAYHLSNFEYVWPWPKWAHVLTAPPHHPQRHFVAAVMQRLVRLSYHDRISAAVPEAFHSLLPPRPAVEALPAAGAADAANGAAAPAELQAATAAELVQMVKRKALVEDVVAWFEGGDLVDRLGGPAASCAAATRGLLVAGGKSFTHTLVALERYQGLLQTLLGRAGAEGEVAMIGAAATAWATSPQRAAMAIDRLMALRLVTGAAIVDWAFAELRVRRFDEELGASCAWEALYAAVNKTIARTQDAQEDVVREKARIRELNPELGEAQLLEAVAPPQEALDAATAVQQALLLQTLQAFKQLLADMPPEAEGQDDGEDGPSAESTWRTFALYSLRSFLRKYFLQLAPLAAQLEGELFAEGAVAADVRAAALPSLRM